MLPADTTPYTSAHTAKTVHETISIVVNNTVGQDKVKSRMSGELQPIALGKSECATITAIAVHIVKYLD